MMTFGEVEEESMEAAKLCFKNPAWKAVFAQMTERKQATVILDKLVELSVLMVSWEWKCV